MAGQPIAFLTDEERDVAKEAVRMLNAALDAADVKSSRFVGPQGNLANVPMQAFPFSASDVQDIADRVQEACEKKSRRTQALQRGADILEMIRDTVIPLVAKFV